MGEGQLRGGLGGLPVHHDVASVRPVIKRAFRSRRAPRYLRKVLSPLGANAPNVGHAQGSAVRGSGQEVGEAVALGPEELVSQPGVLLQELVGSAGSSSAVDVAVPPAVLVVGKPVNRNQLSYSQLYLVRVCGSYLMSLATNSMSGWLPTLLKVFL